MENQLPPNAFTPHNPENPLKKYFRQPKLYIKLPSSGNFYPPGTLEMTPTGEFPVYAMTAKDEIASKTPDALLNGQSTVDIIQSCVPNIKNAWYMPSIDVDAVLIAIRIATYGEQLDVDVQIPNTVIKKTYTTDLRLALDQLLNAVFDPVIPIDDSLTIHISPINYMTYTKNAIKTIEEQRIFALIDNEQMSDEEKLDMFNKSFRKITDITVTVITQSITKISTPDGDVTDRDFINEFIDNAEKAIFTRITKHLELQRKSFEIAPFKVITDEEERAAGAPKEFEAPITLDAANFFG